MIPSNAPQPTLLEMVELRLIRREQIITDQLSCWMLDHHEQLAQSIYARDLLRQWAGVTEEQDETHDDLRELLNTWTRPVCIQAREQVEDYRETEEIE